MAEDSQLLRPLNCCQICFSNKGDAHFIGFATWTGFSPDIGRAIALIYHPVPSHTLHGFWRNTGITLTLNAPNRNKVGSRPTEKIRRRMVEAISARMPWGWGKTMTMARETSIANHRRADKWGSRVPEGGERRDKWPLLFFPSEM